MKKWLKAILCIILAAIVVVAGYLGYVLIDYHRIGNQMLVISGKSDMKPEKDTKYGILSYNIGFGAYEPDYGFFMDGGSESWAWSEERLNANLGNIAAYLKKQNADFYLIQEVDRDSTRSYHVDETVPIVAALGADYPYTWAQNYDSPFLFYPFSQPHGSSVSGILTASRFHMTSANRVELPIEKSLMKLVDLDRCFSVQHIPVEDKELVLFNLHLSAYTSDGTIATEQLERLLGYMQAEYEAGNWCIAGGDFNKDLLGDSSVYFGASDKEYSWAQPIPEGTFDAVDITLVAPIDKNNPVPSCRNADGPYHEGQYVLTVDGFLVSPNVEIESADVMDLGFAYSDHNPVKMEFYLR